MITPLDIQNKEFKKTLLGYKSQEVDSYLDSINEDYEKLYKENIELKDKIGILTDQIKQYNNLEETLKSTLVVAQSTADEVTSSARKKAELIIEDAEISAKNRITSALDEVRKIREEYDKLENEIYMFKTRYESFLKAQLISLEEFHNNFETNKANGENIKADIIKSDDLDKMNHLGA
ncbi:MAG: DivIVA domain-containing protein [Tissierellaceae bacterium]|nr:DivIVA domain-containing protein [Tissierellaceae bacterium]